MLRLKTWTRTSCRTCGGTWALVADPRYTVHHCGHPTALWPYYGQIPGHEGMVLAPNGRGFRHLAEAQAAVEKLHAEALAQYRAEIATRTAVERSRSGPARRQAAGPRAP